MLDLSQHDLVVFLDLLEQAQQRFDNAGCNDYSLDDTPENRDLWRRAVGDDDPNLYNGQLCVNDSILFDHFVECVREHADDLKKSPQNLNGEQAHA